MIGHTVLRDDVTAENIDEAFELGELRSHLVHLSLAALCS
jgi:hypothetical protein